MRTQSVHVLTSRPSFLEDNLRREIRRIQDIYQDAKIQQISQFVTAPGLAGDMVTNTILFEYGE